MNTFSKIQEINANRGNLILKAFGEGETFEKAREANIGEIRKWGDKFYKKQANSKWVEVSEYGMTKKEHEDKEKHFSNRNLDKMTIREIVNNANQKSKHGNIASKLFDREYYESELSKEEETLSTGSIRADKLINQFIKQDLEDGFKIEKVDKFKKELIEAVKMDYEEDDLDKMARVDLYEIYDYWKRQYS